VTISLPCGGGVGPGVLERSEADAALGEAPAAPQTQADVARTYAVDAATISRLAAASPFEQGAIGGLQ
jgi:hypothetical protein